MKARPLLAAIGAPLRGRRCRSRDAARRRRGRARRRRPGRAGAARRRRGRAARPRGLRDAPRLRRATVPARRPSRPARRVGGAPPAAARRRATGSRSRSRRRSPPAACPTRRCGCSGRRARGRRHADGARARLDAPAGLDELRARGLRLASSRGRPGAARRREVDELRGEHGRAGRSRARAAPTTRSSSPPTGSCSRRRRRTSGGARATGCSRRRSTLPLLAGVTRATRAASSRRDAGYGVEEGSFPLERLLARRRGLPHLVGPRGDAGRRRRRRARSRRGPAAAQRSRARCERLPATLPDNERGEDPARRHGARRTACSCTARRSWACAIRTDGRDARGRARRASASAPRASTSPLLRGPARLAESLAFLPQVKRALPAAQLPMQSGRACSRRCSARRSPCAAFASRRLGPAAQELARRAARRSRPRRSRCAAGELAAYHGAEHISIGTLRARRARARRSTSAAAAISSARCSRPRRVGNVLAGLAPDALRGHARAAAQLGALAASTEIFGWMTRHPDNARRAGAVEAGPRAPAPVLDRRADAGAARGRRGRARRLPRARAWRRRLRTRPPARDLRPAGREDARRLVHGRVLQPRARRRCSRTASIRAS